MSLITEPLWRGRKLSRTEWRATHPKRKSVSHGGRGKKYGLKAGKQLKFKRSAA